MHTHDADEAEDDAYSAEPAWRLEAAPLETRHDCERVSRWNCHKSSEEVEGDGAVFGCGNRPVKYPNKHDADAVDQREGR